MIFGDFNTYSVRSSKFSKFDLDEAFGNIIEALKETNKKEMKVLNAPKYKLITTDDSSSINILVPAYKKENFNISTQDGILTVSYTKGEDETSIFNNVVSFEQTYKLSGKEDLKNISTVLESGILTITFPKKAEFLEKVTIDIK